ncbi:murein DD-endopeptidase MepM/ murein hydrolase activator NlpD [Microlunatus panaciterrae]|uniref:Murein DD-endopeptidase MepM/ murein hydrolase activator NlpD n=1 Tax=Microlunatus panaciterrae TaxID=400768 RepID=A0ABS2RF42_9ACTN|nr:M23 family metallopeptidase [Microlunatus panaciterrae]MBM7797582.1 murein DD-endopeptidase MepM/ murein hydrolase activator NlpD [Microlunatus panaciterrae]
MTVWGDTSRARRLRVFRGTVALMAAGAVGLTLMAPLASADDLTDHRDKVKKQISQTQRDLSESTKELSAAAVAVDRAQADLEVAQAQLARTEAELATATQRDIAMAAKLKKAKAQLAKAKAAVAKGQRALDAQEKMAGQQVRDAYQQQTNLMPIAILVQNNSTKDLQTRLQWSTTMFDTTQASIDELTVLQRKLNAERAKQTELEKQIAADRKAAAANLKTKQRLEQQAAAQTANVASLVQAKQSAEASAQHQVAADKQRYADLSRERASVEKRIAARIARAKAEAARKAAAARAARRAAKRAEEARRAREEAAAAARARSSRSSAKRSYPSHKSPSKKTYRRSAPRPSYSSAHHGFIYPVSAPITSPYGMRFHPVLHYWKLHDGTDFGAGCGTAIHAAYSGRVSERYFNAGYGNRLMIDHGMVDGRYVTTGYNHAIRYTVSVGEHVRQGEVIGYVGTTGFSTGCHLHLMVWLDGGMVNPMSWY